MKVYCKRTVFKKNTNLYPVKGKNYGEDYVEWKKGSYYKFRLPEEHEKGGTTDMFPPIYYYIQTEREFIWSPIYEKEFKKNFLDSDEIRDEIINSIIS